MYPVLLKAPVSDIMKDIKNLEQKQAKMEQENEQLKQQLAALKK